MDPNDSIYKLRTSDYQITDTVITDTATFFAGYPRDPNSYNIETSTVYIDSLETYDTAFNMHRYLSLGISDNVYYLSSTQQTVRFLLPDELFFKRPDRNLYIDFGTGSAPVLAEADGVYEVEYPLEGTYQVRILEDPECNPAEETCIKSTFEIQIAYVNGPSSQFVVDPHTIVNECSLDYELDQELRDFGGGKSFGSAVISTWLREDNPDSEGRITRPVIVLDGFNSFEAYDEIHDRTRYTPAAGYGYGKINSASISSGVFPYSNPDPNKPPKPNRALQRFPSFIDSVTSSDYDFVFIDWHTNRTSIQANANAFKEILQQINKQMQDAGSVEEIVVIGPSMGGQIARVAIREMELANCCHNVRLYASFDSPHRGANIPLALQYNVYSMYTHFDINSTAWPTLTHAEGARQTFEWVLASPAARQMLVEHILGNTPSESYYNYINSIGFPELPELIAITNGSYQGIFQGDRQYIDPDDNTKVAQTQTAMTQGSPYFTLKANLPAYVTVPTDPTLLVDLISSPIDYNNDFSLMYAKPYVATADPTGGSNQLLLERGLSIDQNLIAYAQYLGAVGYWNFTFYQNAYHHSALMVSQSACLPCVGALGISWLAQAAVISAKGSAVLAGEFALNQIANYNSTTHHIYRNSPTLAWDHLPGSFITTPSDFYDLAPDYIALNHPRHTFMPTVSTIALMGTDDFSTDISSITDPELLASTPFTSIYFNYSVLPEGAISHNQEHVEITLHGIQWIMNQIRKSERIPDGYLNAQGNWDLNTTYNFGSPIMAMNEDPAQNISLQYIPSVNVLSGGSLRFNTDMPLGFGGIARPKVAHYSISATNIGCDAQPSVVDINVGGELVIGDGFQNARSADVYFPSGSQLVLSGTLTINNSSRLIIEEGAELVVNPGATINLDGSTSELVIQGKLVMAQNADFNPQGIGAVRLDQEGMLFGNANNYYQAGGNNEFRIEGSDSSVVRLYVDETSFFTQVWDSVIVNNTKILISGDKYLDVRAKLRAQRVSINLNTENVGSGVHSGIRFYGFNPSIFKNNTVQRGKFGVFVNAIVGTDNTKYISGSRFLHNQEGVSTRGGNFHFTDCEFVNNDIGMRLKDFSSASSITSNRFSINDIGVYANSPSNQSLSISTSIFYNNFRVGLFAEEITANLGCSSWEFNEVAVRSDYAQINLSNSALCDFISNDTVFKLVLSRELYLKSGFNSFSGNYRIAEGDFYFTSGSGNLTTTDGITYKLDMKDNYPNQTLNYSMVANIGGSNYNVQLQNTGYSTILNSCSFPKGPDFGSNKTGFVYTPSSSLKVLSSLSSYNTQLLTTGNFTGLTVSAAIESLFATDSINELATIDSLFMIMGDMTLSSAVDSSVYWSVMSASVKHLMSDRTTQSSALLMAAKNSLNAVAANANGDYAAMMYHLLSSVERNDQNYSLAISLNQSALSQNTSLELQNLISYWACILPAERNLYDGFIDFDTYENQEQLCRQLYSLKNSRSSGAKTIELTTSSSDGVVVYPNPTDDCSVVRPIEIRPLNVVVQDMSGVVVHSFDLNNANDHEYLCTENYSPGVYILSVYDENGNFVESIRWVAMH